MRDDLVKNRKGKIVSRKKSRQASEFNNLGEWLRDKGDKFQGKTTRQEEKQNEPEKAPKPKKPVPKPKPKKPVPKPKPVPKKQPKKPAVKQLKPRPRPKPHAHPRPKPRAPPKAQPKPKPKPQPQPKVEVHIADRSIAKTVEPKDNPKHWSLSVTNIRPRRQRKRVDYSKFY
jgi:hypothetical protein